MNHFCTRRHYLWLLTKEQTGLAEQSQSDLSQGHTEKSKPGCLWKTNTSSFPFFLPGKTNPHWWMKGLYHTHHQAQVLQYASPPQSHTYPAPGEGSVPAALQHLDSLMPQKPLEVHPTGCFTGPPGSVLVLWQPRHRAKAGWTEGKSSSCIYRVSVPQPRAHKSLLPTCNITLLVAAIASSYDDGKAVLLVAIIKTSRGRHLLFSATAEITFLTQTFWSWIILKCLCKDHQQVSPSRLTLSVLQLWAHPVFFWSQANAEERGSYPCACMHIHTHHATHSSLSISQLSFASGVNGPWI